MHIGDLCGSRYATKGTKVREATGKVVFKTYLILKKGKITMAMKKQIRLEKIDDAMEFVNLASKVKGDVWLSNESGSRASGKSILGVFDVAVNSPMDVEYPDDANEEFDDFLCRLELAARGYMPNN